MYCECGCGQKTKLARQTDRKKGYVKGQPLRWISGSHATRKPDNLYRLEDKGFQTPCWVWHGHLHDGYGHTRDMPAYRYYYLKYKGPIPKDHVIHHHCNVKACVSPDHLEAVSPQVNAALRYYPPFTPTEVIVPKQAKSFRLSEATSERLERLSKEWEMSQTLVVEQLIKEAAADTEPLTKEGAANAGTASY